MTTELVAFDLEERERIRQALLSFMKEHGIGTPDLAKHIEQSHPRRMHLPLKTLQRFLGRLTPLPDDATPEEIERAKPTRTHDMALIICKAFVEKLPNKPMPFSALGLALEDIYQQELADDISGEYDLTHEGALSSQFSISAATDCYALVTERSKEIHCILDGVIVGTTPGNHLAILRDRLMMTPRYVMLSGEEAHVYEFCPLKHPRNTLIFDAKFSRHA